MKIGIQEKTKQKTNKRKNRRKEELTLEPTWAGPFATPSHEWSLQLALGCAKKTRVRRGIGALGSLCLPGCEIDFDLNLALQRRAAPA